MKPQKRKEKCRINGEYREMRRDRLYFFFNRATALLNIIRMQRRWGWEFGYIIANCNRETRRKRREMRAADVIQRERVETQDIT